MSLPLPKPTTKTKKKKREEDKILAPLSCKSVRIVRSYHYPRTIVSVTVMFALLIGSVGCDGTRSWVHNEWWILTQELYIRPLIVQRKVKHRENFLRFRCITFTERFFLKYVKTADDHDDETWWSKVVQEDESKWTRTCRFCLSRVQ